MRMALSMSLSKEMIMRMILEISAEEE